MREPIDPPAGATRMLSCFAHPDVPQILGDMMEEFRERVQTGGAPQARRWYWRETLRNAIALFRRKPALPILLAALLCFVAIHLVMTVASVLEWQRWAIQFAALNGHAVPATRYLGWYGWSWKLAFPPGTGFPQELSMGMLTGLLTGGIFAYLVRGRVQALRLATIGFWLLFAAVFFVRSVFFLHFDPRWHGNSLFVVRMLLLNFAIREFVCAGSFWLGTYLPSLNRSSWRQVSH